MRITLIGSAKFLSTFDQWNNALTQRGDAVYSLGVRRVVDDSVMKKVLDAVHLTKIQNSDAVLLINNNDYIGESTMGELLFAMITHRQLFCTQKPKVRSWGIGFCPIAPALNLLGENFALDNWVLTNDDVTDQDKDQASSDRSCLDLPLTSPLVERAYPQAGPGLPGQKYSSVSKY